MPLHSDSSVQDVRAQLLRTAYLNTQWPIKPMALATDMALAALEATDPGAAAQLVKDMAGHGGALDRLILERAQAADVPDRDTWEQRATLLRDFTRLPYASDKRDADSEARRLWAGLLEYLPQVAAALAQYLQRLPEGWMLDLFAVESVEQISHGDLVGEGYRPPEVAPYEDGDDCPACADVQNMCRVHIGFERGVDYARSLLATAAADATALGDLDQRRQQVAEQAAGDQAALFDAADPVEALLALLGTDYQAWEQLQERHHELDSRRARADHYRAQGDEALAQQILEGKEWA
jgi:hypothetical protein